MVMIQQPATLDAVCALAMVQEEAVDSGRKKDFRRFDSTSSRATSKPTFPLPPPPVFDKSPAVSVSEEKRGLEHLKSTSADEKF
jgi:hypothetical protein